MAQNNLTRKIDQIAVNKFGCASADKKELILACFAAQLFYKIARFKNRESVVCQRLEMMDLRYGHKRVNIFWVDGSKLSNKVSQRLNFPNRLQEYLDAKLNASH